MKFSFGLILIIIGLQEGYFFQHLPGQQSHRNNIRTDKRHTLDVDEIENDTLKTNSGPYDNISSFTNIDIKNGQYSIIDEENQHVNGLFPPLFDVAPLVHITANATCGTTYLGSEETFCKLGGSMQCGICSGITGDKKHSITFAIDKDVSNWWQSPSLDQGSEFEYVTVTMDLKQNYYVWYVIIKCAISPRPANWVLERSLDGIHFSAWQYFVANEDDCWQRYRLSATTVAAGSHTVHSDNETLCSTFYSKIKPLEGGEIHAFVAKGRPGCVFRCTVINTNELKEFSIARYLRFRFQKFNIPKDKYSSLSDSSFQRRLFYSIKKISVGAQCICHGHANKCKRSSDLTQPHCECHHNTCGANCEQCCPLYNQKPWREATVSEVSICEQCQCHGHAEICRYDPHVDASNASLNIHGEYRGGGICINCTKHTTGVNCERCESGWYRPNGVKPNSDEPCLPCDCHQIGSIEYCVSDDSKFLSENKKAGSCECLQGFDGLKCDSCAIGFYNFPNCEKCMCDPKGTDLTKSCEKHCICKTNVAGEMCDRCKSGYFDLSSNDPRGCKECYCSGLSTICSEAFGYRLNTIRTLDEWLITNINVTSFISPTWDNEAELLTISDNEVQVDANNYYWLAPNKYTGNKLSSYGLTFRLSILWTVMRGDTSGKPVFNPDIIIVGNNGLKIAYGNKKYEDISKIMLSVRLSENGWYRLPDNFQNNIHYSYEPINDEEIVSRRDMLSVLSNVKHILLRAKFHTDQIDCSLSEVQLETGIKEKNENKEIVLGLEQCICPVGYTGLSCENCTYGYVRLQPESKFNHFICSLCDCNGHSPSCNPVTGQCETCEHNTTGVKCERCLDGYYGNAEIGTPVDCQLCACPLSISSNNFSLTCTVTNALQNEYVCDRCPVGYSGTHCETCNEGYFGNPLEIGSKCGPCDCKGGPCNSTTGQCLSCVGNTEGWNCEQCKDGFYRNAVEKNCSKCNCNPHGSINGTFCDKYTGRCKCKISYAGRTCDRCLDGFGNLSTGCVPCNCNIIGSQSQLCDSVTGICSCKVSVTGALCDSCSDNFYNFESGDGCLSCDCNKTGSISESCDAVLGQCKCKKNVIGRTCNQCQEGFWNFNEDGCKPCECNEIGSVSSLCDTFSGKCSCKFGVTGRECDRCQNNFYGFSKYGCFECENCSKPGHICDVHSGQCVCPIRTEGLHCYRCVSSAWNYSSVEGCQECNCDRQGSKSNQCKIITGHCECRVGYSGEKCNTCAPGYYGFPKCRPCSCNRAGSDPETCFDNHCLCNNEGHCYCKANTMGKKCNQCKEGTFGLDDDNVHGCTSCFCFGRSTLCSEAGLMWSHIKLRPDRILFVHYNINNNTSSNFTSTDIFPVNTQEICFINFALPNDDANKNLENNDRNIRLNVTNNLRLIPGDIGNVEIGVNYLFDAPIYWQLPNTFLGDKILSYGGFIEFTAETEGETTLLPPAVIATYPLLQIQGNDKFILEYFPPLITLDKHHRVRLHESLWKLKNNPTGHVSRDIFMLTLQNLQHVLIRASKSIDFTKAILSDISMDTAIESKDLLPPLSSITHGTELCECPIPYSSSSCQNPSIGYYRNYGNRTAVTSTIVIQVVGEAVPCSCNGYSSICDVETGICLNCSNNTGGARCESCAVGYYKSEIDGSCKSCQCPSALYNHAHTCYLPEPSNLEKITCFCKTGYTGKLCDRCNYGWYGYPKTENGYCKPCNCNPYGSISDECHEETGQCNCKPNSTGRDCSLCEGKNHALTLKGCSLCEDNCVQILINDAENMVQQFKTDSQAVFHGKLKPPWHLLNEINNSLDYTKNIFDSYLNVFLRLSSYDDTIEEDLKKKLRVSINKMKRMWKYNLNLNSSIYELSNDVVSIFKMAQIIHDEIKSVISNLEKYIKSEQIDFNLPAVVNEARYLLNNIKDTENIDLMEKVKKVKSICAITEEAVRKHENSGPGLELLKKLIEKLIERIEDLDSIVSNTSLSIQQVRSYSDLSTGKLQWISNMSVRTNDILFQVNDIQKENEFFNNSIVQLINIRESNAKDINSMLASLKNLIHLAEEKEGILFNLNPIYLETYVNPAIKHADGLLNRAKHYVGLFVPTKQDADIALKASRAYKNIVDALDEARLAINEANITAGLVANKLYSKINHTSTLDKVRSMEETSRQLKTSANIELSDVEMLRKQYEHQQKHVEILEKKLQEITMNVSSIFYQFIDINRTKDKLKYINETLERFTNSTKISDKVYDSIFLIQDNINDELKPKLNKIQSYGEISIHPKDEFKIKQAEEDTSKMISLLYFTKNLFNERYKYFEKWNSSIADQLSTLKNRIDLTKHLANGIHLSMSSKSDQEMCMRSYRSKYLKPSITNDISITYAISSHHKDALLFYLASSVSGDFLAVEMVNRKIRFIWDVGGGPAEVIHHLQIQTASDLQKDQHWYKIEVERIANVGKLSVRPVVPSVSSILAYDFPVTNASITGWSKFDVTSNDEIWVGGTNKQVSPFLLSKQTGLIGCLYSVSFDNRPVGLWNFETETPSNCMAYIEGAEEIQEDDSYFFIGDGYSVLHDHGSTVYNKYFFSVAFSFKTFDENAVLFYAAAANEQQYISVTLKDGRILLRIGYTNELKLEIKSTNRYTTGNWTHLEAARYYDRKRKTEKGVLKVGSETKEGIPVPSSPNQNDIPDLSAPQYFVGGLPPDFKPPISLPGSFLGCMSDLQVVQESYNPLRGYYWGIKKLCLDKPLTVVGFRGNGYLELASYPLEKSSSFNFVFSTTQKNAFLMLSTTEGFLNSIPEKEIYENNSTVDDKIYDKVKKTNYYSVSLRDGRTELVVNAGNGETRLLSRTDSYYNDGQFHSINVIKTGTRLELRVDDVIQAIGFMEEDGSGTVKAAGNVGGLFFGGLPVDFNLTESASSNFPLIGTIKNAIFNDKLLYFDRPIEFERALIGRLGPQQSYPNWDISSLTQNTQSTVVNFCQGAHTYSLEPFAVQFGDLPNSYVRLDYDRNVLHNKGGVIQLDFRTFYSDGILLIIPGSDEKQDHNLKIILHNSKIFVIVKGKKKIEMQCETVYNDGNWHRIKIMRSGKILQLTVDDILSQKVTIPKKLNLMNIVFVGGFLNEMKILESSLLKIEAFKGCIKEVIINDKKEDLVGESAKHHHVGQCFARVEKGAYFSGDAYSVYANNFYINGSLKFKLEFRTSEMNGILMLVFEPDGYPALSLELNRGKIILKGDVGDGQPFKVETNFPSMYHLCDNEWHRVEVTFINAQITLYVDDSSKMYMLSDNGHITEVHTNSSLYIGGIPEHVAGGTLENKENFKGCIRYIEIGELKLKWTELSKLHNVLVSSCPALK